MGFDADAEEREYRSEAMEDALKGEIEDLKIELSNAKEALRDMIDHMEAEYGRGYRAGFNNASAAGGFKDVPKRT